MWGLRMTPVRFRPALQENDDFDNIFLEDDTLLWSSCKGSSQVNNAGSHVSHGAYSWQMLSKPNKNPGPCELW